MRDGAEAVGACSWHCDSTLDPSSDWLAGWPVPVSEGPGLVEVEHLLPTRRWKMRHFAKTLEKLKRAWLQPGLVPEVSHVWWSRPGLQAGLGPIALTPSVCPPQGLSWKKRLHGSWA